MHHIWKKYWMKFKYWFFFIIEFFFITEKFNIFDRKASWRSKFFFYYRKLHHYYRKLDHPEFLKNRLTKKFHTRFWKKHFFKNFFSKNIFLSIWFLSIFFIVEFFLLQSFFNYRKIDSNYRKIYFKISSKNIFKKSKNFSIIVSKISRLTV